MLRWHESLQWATSTPCTDSEPSTWRPNDLHSASMYVEMKRVTGTRGDRVQGWRGPQGLFTVRPPRGRERETRLSSVNVHELLFEDSRGPPPWVRLVNGTASRCLRYRLLLPPRRENKKKMRWKKKRLGCKKKKNDERLREEKKEASTASHADFRRYE